MHKHLSYLDRSEITTHPLAKYLLHLMAQKKTNLSVAVDVVHAEELLHFADLLGPEICVLKTHIDILEDFTPSLIPKLKQLAQQHRFIIFEDRKFADIGNTVQLQYAKGIYRIAEWAAITNAHVITGPGIITGLKQIGLPLGNGLLLLAEISAAGNLVSPDYTRAAVAMAEENKDFVIGFITQRQLSENPGFLNLCPGVSLAASGDALGQQYNSPERAIIENNNDIIIVGRGIYLAKDPKSTAKEYREVGWDAYRKKIAQACP